MEPGKKNIINSVFPNNEKTQATGKCMTYRKKIIPEQCPGGIPRSSLLTHCPL